MVHENIRYSGILMHITSLPGKYGIGTLGDEAYRFADDLHKTGATIWQMLPFGPTGYGNSPYAPRSSFAGNELFINLEYLVEDGLLEEEDLLEAPEFKEDKVEFDSLIAWKLPLLKKAAASFMETCSKNREYREFKKASSYWLEDYAMFMVLYEKYQDARWHTLWDDKYRRRQKTAMAKLKKEHKAEIETWMVLQFLFDRQWSKLRSYCNGLGIKIVGDIPIFVGADSADTWSHIELFKTDSSGRYSAQAGVPPDGFSATGQLWGNPIYDWKKHEETGFEWWIERMRRVNQLCDIVRIDHFRGLDAYYEIKASAKTAEVGKWTKSPGKKLFNAIKASLGDVNIIAEDLGLMTPSVEKLRDGFGFPGMKIAQFGFTRDEYGNWNPYDTFLPHNYTEPFVAYTGTHDNETTRGWFSNLSDEDKHAVREYLWSSDEEIVWNMIRSVMFSHARYAIFPMQDILEKGNEARMNCPSTCNDFNWSWKMKEGEFSDERISRFAHMVRVSGRNGLSWQQFEEIEKKKAEERKALEEESEIDE